MASGSSDIESDRDKYVARYANEADKDAWEIIVR